MFQPRLLDTTYRYLYRKSNVSEKAECRRAILSGGNSANSRNCVSENRYTEMSVGHFFSPVDFVLSSHGCSDHLKLVVAEGVHKFSDSSVGVVV